MSELLDAALGYAADGWPVFPCVPGEKRPLIENGVLKATTDAKQIEQWWKETPNANIGMHCFGAGFMVLDYDPGADHAQLDRNVGGVPSSKLIAKTPRGGQHVFYRLKHKDQIISNSASAIAKNVDVRCYHGYVLVEPSHTKDGVYSWVSEGEPGIVTDEMVRIANTHREKHKDRDVWIIEPDMPENVDKAVEWLKTEARPAIEGEGGDNNTYAAAAMMHSFGISQEKGAELLEEHYNPRCSPPWGFEELQAKIENAYEYHTSQPGNMTRAYHEKKVRDMFKPVHQVQRKLDAMPERSSDSRFKFWTRDEMENIPPPTWIIKDFIPDDGYSLIFGDYASYKTFVALDIALSVATGKGRWDVVKTGPVLYAAGEGHASIIKRVRAWERKHNDGKKVENFILTNPVPAPIDADFVDFTKEATRMSPEGYVLTVIDTVNRSMAGMSADKQEEASKFTRMVDGLRLAICDTVLAVHHAGHTNKGRWMGSVVFGTDADMICHVNKVDEYLTELDMTPPIGKQKDAPEWKEPLLLKMQEVKLSVGQTSLVVVEPDDADRAKAKAAKKKKSKNAPRQQDLINISQEWLDDAIEVALKEYPGRQFSDDEVAQAVAAREDCNLGSKTMILGGHFRAVRENTEMNANIFYDPSTKKWKWRKLD